MSEEQDSYRRLIEHMPDGFAYHQVVVDPDGRPIDYVFLDANPAFETLTRLDREHLIGQKATAVLPGIERSAFDWIGTYGQVALGGQSVCFEQYFEPLERWYEVAAYSDRQGYFTTVFHDITSRKQMEGHLRASEERFRSLFELSLDAIFFGAPDGSVIDVNQAWLDLFGYSREELPAFNIARAYVNKADRENFLRGMLKSGAVNDEIQLRRKDGSIFDCARTSIVRRDDEGNVTVFQGIMRDVTARKRAEQALRESEQKFRSLFELSMDAMYIGTPEGNIIDVNQAWMDLFGYQHEDLPSITALDLYANPADRAGFVRQLEETGWIRDEVLYKRKEGTVFDCQRIQVALKDDSGKVVAYQGVNRDITQQKHIYAELERLARFDMLTGLLNRRAIMEKLDEWLHHVKRYKGHLSIAMLDIDHFKLVNDRYGHMVGDRVLADTAHIVQRGVRLADFAGRYGGEEFLVVLPKTDAVAAAIMAERTRTSLQDTSMQNSPTKPFHVTVSIGIAEWHKGEDMDALVGRADEALYRAKAAGRNRVEVASFVEPAE